MNIAELVRDLDLLIGTSTGNSAIGDMLQAFDISQFYLAIAETNKTVLLERNQVAVDRFAG